MAEAKISAAEGGGGDLLAAFDSRVRRVVEEAVSSTAPHARAAADILDEKTRREIQEQALLSHKTYLTRREVATYLAVSERSVSEWSARPPGQNPFPVAYAGGEPRYKRAAVDKWAAEEARRRLAG